MSIMPEYTKALYLFEGVKKIVAWCPLQQKLS